MHPDLLFRGLVIGVSIAAPVGPIGLLCIRRTLADGRLAGLATGLGAATADAAYGAVAAFGLTAIASLLVDQSLWLRLIGGLFLLYLGTRTALTPPAERAAIISGRGLAGAYATTLLLTLTNPLTILSFVGIFAGLGIAGSGGDWGAATTMVVGVFAGSALWWLLLSGGVGLVRGAVTSGALRWVNRLSGAIIATAGLVALGSVVWGG